MSHVHCTCKVGLVMMLLVCKRQTRALFLPRFPGGASPPYAQWRKVPPHHILSYHPLKYSYTHIRFYETSVFAATPEQYFFFRVHTKLHDILGSNPKVNLLASSPLDQLLGGNQPNKLAKLGDAIASHLKLSLTDSLTH